MDKKLKTALNSAGFCAALLLSLLLVGAGGYFLFHSDSRAEQTPEVTDQVRQPAAAEHAAPPASVIPEPEEVAVPEPVQKPEPEPPAMPEAEPVMEPEELPELEELPEPEDPTVVVSPLRGEILTAFSMEELLYSETLGDWRTHDGLDIGAVEGTTVLSACSGRVVAVEDDPMLGTAVTIEHDGGYQTHYANLESQPPVLAGDEVSAGQIIGAVGQTAAAESAQPPHLHFSVTLDGEPVNPEEFLEP